MSARLIVSWTCLVLAGCGQQAGSTGEKNAEKDKIKQRKEITALYDAYQREKRAIEFHRKRLDSERKHLQEMERKHGKTEFSANSEKIIEEESKEWDAAAQRADDLDRQAKEKYGVPANELPKLYAP